MAGVVINGSAGSDTLTGTEGADTINGRGGGTDLIWGGAGSDSIFDGGLTLQARVYGEGGDDDLFIGTNIGSLVDGGDGADYITAYGSGNHTVLGGAGDDTIYGGSGQDSLVGGDGNDHISGDFSSNDLGTDTLIGGRGDDWVIGSGGSDLWVLDWRETAAFAAVTPFRNGQHPAAKANDSAWDQYDRQAAERGYTLAVGDAGGHTLWGKADGPATLSWQNDSGVDTIARFDFASGDRIQIEGVSNLSAWAQHVTATAFPASPSSPFGAIAYVELAYDGAVFAHVLGPTSFTPDWFVT